ncbi:hypothetical protein [Aneurinibacillus migulanus]|uniref:Uncharacterized protein n=1 Tax=Aneurinibacillus migulanus TaxID=47500 RepID=A0A0D1WGM6_ANEMI|nr:hypothetical protein [Aneurinibacillus migulanus]KIV57690.1 hypothetical protein TS65_09200 [Aneurinibacillus migulanus]KON95870.1 hypothetical protein AF333_10610 [Aneurinibacillus migulanus]MED0891958.1 hypothetical protein [Aneurinibacillus migulanus]MED1617302.1 hypothetical protein [Aneurinibacillus migulanus]SDK26582.1 hypothetical protein SAMN04487909_14628 [Aneurinibacillus migulanus]
MGKFTQLFNLQGFDVMPPIENLERFITKYFPTHRIILYEATEVIGYDMQNFKKVGERRLLIPYAHEYSQSDILLDPIGTPVEDFPQENIWRFNEIPFHSHIILLPDGTESPNSISYQSFRRFYADYYSTFYKKVGYLNLGENGWYSINNDEHLFYEFCIAHWLSGFRISYVVIESGFNFYRGMVGGPNPTFLLESEPITNRKALLALGADGFNGVPSVMHFSREAEIVDVGGVDESYFSGYKTTTSRKNGYFHTYLKNVKRIPVIDEQEFIRGLYIGINIKASNIYNNHSHYGMSGINRSFYEGLVIGMAIKNSM